MSKRVQTTEATGKRWKAPQAIGCALCILAIIAYLLLGVGADIQGSRVATTLLLLLGLSIYSVARVGAWWYHG